MSLEGVKKSGAKRVLTMGRGADLEVGGTNGRLNAGVSYEPIPSLFQISVEQKKTLRKLHHTFPAIKFTEFVWISNSDYTFKYRICSAQWKKVNPHLI